MMLFHRKGEYYPYDGYFMKGMFLHFINRVINPVVLLKSEVDIDRFINSETEYQEQSEFFKNKYEPFGDYYRRMSKRVRVIAFIHDKAEYKNELRLFQEAAQSLSGKRDDLRVGLVTNKTLINIYKARYSAKWFDEYSLNTIVLEREPGVFAYYDIEKENTDISHWMNKFSLKKNGEEINRESFFIAKSLNQAKVYLYIENKNKQQVESKMALDAFQRVAPFFFEHFVFFYAEAERTPTEYLDRRFSQGIFWSSYPSMTVVTPKGSFYPVSIDVQLTDKIIEEHLLNFTKGILPKPQIDESSQQKWANQDHDILERLGNTRTLTKFNIKETVYSSEIDVVLFVYSSDKTDPNWQR